MYAIDTFSLWTIQAFRVTLHVAKRAEHTGEWAFAPVHEQLLSVLGVRAAECVVQAGGAVLSAISAVSQ